MDELAYSERGIRNLYTAMVLEAVRTIQQSSYPSHAEAAATWLMETGVQLIEQLEIGVDTSTLPGWVQLQMARREYARTVRTILTQVNGQLQEIFTHGIQD